MSDVINEKTKDKNENSSLDETNNKNVESPEQDMKLLSLADGERKHSADHADSQVKREKFTYKIDFLFACLGSCIGLGNVWRFPYLCYKNGGGAFLLPYIICTILTGLPLLFLEVSMGQYSSGGAIKAWRICPLMQGLGISMVMVGMFSAMYYIMVIAWAFYYLFASFKSNLPWSGCENDWNTENCRLLTYEEVICENGNQSNTDLTECFKNGYYNISKFENIINITARLNINLERNSTFSVTNSTILTDPATEFWQHKVLGLSTGIEDIGIIKWDLALCLLLAWIIVTLSVWKGVKSSGIVLYFTVIIPYILMLVLLIRGVTLPGSWDGIKFYVIPNWSRLGDTLVWTDAANQVFFSCGISCGILPALGSYNKFNHNCYRDALIFFLINGCTSFTAGFIIFSVLGFMAGRQGVSVADVSESGPGLAFIAYPQAVVHMPWAPLWSVLFFSIIIFLAIDSQFVAVESLVTAVVDIFPLYFEGIKRKILLCTFSVFCFLIGLSMSTNGGMYIFQLFDNFAIRMSLLIGFLECLAIACIYGANRYYSNLTKMLKFRINIFMKICWMGLTPVIILTTFVIGCYQYTEVTYNRTYHYPKWAVALGWVMSCSTVVMVPVIMVLRVLQAPGETLIQKIMFTTKPNKARATASKTVCAQEM